jgi:hypothetical protein
MMERRSEPVWLDARNAVLDLVCIVLLSPAPLPLALWFTMFVYDTRSAVTLGSRPVWGSPYVAAARAWETPGAIVLTLLAYFLAGWYAAKAPTPWKRLLRAGIGAVVLVGLGVGLMIWDPFGSVYRQFD